MKKHLFFATTAALVLASCSSDSVDFTQADVLQAQDDNSVQFDTYMGKTGTTRAYTSGPIANEANATTGEKALSEAEFGVFAYQTTTDYVNETTPTTLAPNFMYNQQVTWSASSPTGWVYTPVKYWPNGIDAANGEANPSNTATSTNNDRLSFFAYAPYMAETSFTDDYAGTIPTALSVAGDAKQVASPTNGIVAMTKNTFEKNVWVKYLMPNANQNAAVDLLWGTNGRKSYYETDGSNPTLSAIGDGYNMNLTKQIVGEKVKFLFKHALAKIGGNTETTELVTDPASNTCGYMIKLDVDGNNGDNQNGFQGSLFTNEKTLVTVEEVEIMDGASAATAGIATTGTTSNLANSGWFNIEQGKWEKVEVATAGATYSITANNTNTDVTDATYSLNPKIKEGTPKNIAGGTWQAANDANDDYTGGATGVTVAAQPLFAKENVPGLMVIPGSGTQTLYVCITYKVRTLDANLKNKCTEVAQTITNKVDLSSLKSNKYYKIIMHLGLTSVKFEAVVSDWQMYSDSSIDENGQETGGTDVNEASVWLPSNVVDAAITTAVQTKATGTVDVTITGLQGSTLTVSSVDGDMVENDAAVTNLGITAGSATVHIAYKANTGAARNGTVVLTDGHKTITITIPQATGL